MKNLILSLLILSLFSACIPDEPDPRVFPEACTIKTEVSAPEGYKIQKIEIADFAGSFQHIQFISADVGYILGSKQAGGRPAIFKTEDAGESWVALPVESDKNHRQMFFMDDLRGFITLYDVAGCPDNCQHRCLMLKTTDGGLTWQEVEIPNLKGTIHHMQIDANRRLYANLYHDQGSTIIKSSDMGTTWDTLYASPELKIQKVTFSLQLFEDKLYATATEGRLFVIDTVGTFLQTLTPGQGSILDFQIIDDQTFIVGGNQISISTDGGSLWTPIIGSRSRMIHFFSPEKGLVIQTVASCPTDVVTLDDVISLTDDGGTNWVQSAASTNLILFYANSQVMANGRVMMMVRDGIYEIEEM